MIKHFTEFHGKPYGAGKGEVRITLNQKKVFVLNGKAVEALKNATHVKLFFDEGRKVIGMRRTTADHPNAFKLNSFRSSRHRTITAASFCAHFKISIEGTALFQNPKLEGDLLTLDLTKTVNVSRGAR